LIEYYTDGSKVNDQYCSGFVCYKKHKKQYTQAVVPNARNIHHAELIGIKNAIYDYLRTYAPGQCGMINTDSDAAYSLIQSRDERYPEVEEINQVLDRTDDVRIRVVKSHATISQQIDYAKRQGYDLSVRQARLINNGNAEVDNFVKNGAYSKDTMRYYESTPFKIRV